MWWIIPGHIAIKRSCCDLSQAIIIKHTIIAVWVFVFRYEIHHFIHFLECQLLFRFRHNQLWWFPLILQRLPLYQFFAFYFYHAPNEIGWCLIQYIFIRINRSACNSFHQFAIGLGFTFVMLFLCFQIWKMVLCSLIERARLDRIRNGKLFGIGDREECIFAIDILGFMRFIALIK